MLFLKGNLNSILIAWFLVDSWRNQINCSIEAAFDGGTRVVRLLCLRAQRGATSRCLSKFTSKQENLEYMFTKKKESL